MPSQPSLLEAKVRAAATTAKAGGVVSSAAVHQNARIGFDFPQHGPALIDECLRAEYRIAYFGHGYLHGDQTVVVGKFVV
jgi:hypothetical protein